MESSGGMNVKQEFTFVQWFIVSCALLVFLIATHVYATVLFLYAQGDTPLWERAQCYPLCAIFLCIAFLLYVLLVRRRLTIGRIFLTQSEVLAMREEMRDRCGAGKPLWPQVKHLITPLLLFLAVAAFAFAPLLSGDYLSGDERARTMRVVLVLIVVALILPVSIAAWRIKQHGSILRTQEEIAELRSRDEYRHYKSMFWNVAVFLPPFELLSLSSLYLMITEYLDHRPFDSSSMSSWAFFPYAGTAHMDSHFPSMGSENTGHRGREIG